MVRSVLTATALAIVGSWAWGGDSAPPRAQSKIQTAAEIAATLASAKEQTSRDKFLVFGVRVSRANDLMRRHLALGHGVGLVVEDVAPGSPAARAGIERHDVLVEIDGQSLIVPEQFQVLIEATGDAAPRQCAAIRAGRKQFIPLSGAAPPAAAASTAATKRPLKPTPSVASLLPPKKKTAAQAAIPRGKESGLVRRTGEYSFVQDDPDYSINVYREDETRIVVRDSRGITIFRNAIETPEQRSRIPLAVRDRVEQLEKMLPRETQAAAPTKPVAEIGRLDIPPVEVK